MDTVTMLQGNAVMGKSLGQTDRERRGQEAWIGLNRKKNPLGIEYGFSFLDSKLVHWEHFSSVPTSFLFVSADLFSILSSCQHYWECVQACPL